jgi:hypothetical protein
MEEKPRDLSLGEIKEIVGKVPGLKRAILHGIGEPLLNRELPDIIGCLKEREVHVLFNSSALLLSKKWAQQLISSGLDELRVSLDAAAESTYVRVRGSDNFLKVVKNIEALVQMRKACHQSTPKISAWMVATQENVEDLPEMIKLAARVEIDEVYLQRLVYPIIISDCRHSPEKHVPGPPPWRFPHGIGARLTYREHPLHSHGCNSMASMQKAMGGGLRHGLGQRPPVLHFSLFHRRLFFPHSRECIWAAPRPDLAR